MESSINAYKIVDSVDKGKIVIAAKDFRPGEIIFEEEPTLFLKKDEHVTSFYENMENTTRIPATAWCLFDAFLRLSEEKKELILSLHGPTYTPNSMALRELFRLGKVPFTDSMRDEFFKVCSVACHNAFGEKELGAENKIFTGALTRMSHSCISNCGFTSDKNVYKVFARTHIKCDEELTISYNCDFDDKPIHVRRAWYLKGKEFLCMCPRCTAPGDDNRQFNCSDAKCRGRMLACQPTSEHVPYLLPCSVCERSASEAFTAEMFAIEKRMPEITGQLKAGMNRASSELEIEDGEQLRLIVGLLIPKRYPTYHRLSVHISDAVCAFLAGSEDINAYFGAIDIILLPFEGKLDVLSFDLVWAYTMVANRWIVIDILKSKEYMQKAVRVFMLLTGRKERDKRRDYLLNVIMSDCPPMFVKLTECAFCGETPEAVAITLSRCARCQKVAYCGRGCQLAHWDEVCKKIEK